jgi:hypothetical protein
MSLSDEQADWEVTPEGLYIATRHFLQRRGYCCGNRCRNCPYFNWHENPSWQHAPAEVVRQATVSPRVLAGVRAALARHEQQLVTADRAEQSYHSDLIAHYRLLLQRWR